MLDLGPRGCNLSGVPWGVRAGPGGASGALRSYNHEHMNTAIGVGKLKMVKNSSQETLFARF